MVIWPVLAEFLGGLEQVMRSEADPDRATPRARVKMALLSLRGEAAEPDANPGIVGDRVDSLA